MTVPPNSASSPTVPPIAIAAAAPTALVSGDLHSVWIYLTAPFLGAVLGVVAYQLVRGSEETATENKPA